MKKKLRLTAIGIFAWMATGYSQTQGIAYTAVGKVVATTFLTDYHSLGINSSALGWGNAAPACLPGRHGRRTGL